MTLLSSIGLGKSNRKKLSDVNFEHTPPPPKSDKEIEEENLKMVRDFINNPEEKQKALVMANQIKETAFSHFFTEKQFMKKFNLTKIEFDIKINALKVFGFICQRTIDTKEGEAVTYKIDIDKTNQIHFKELEIQSYEYKIEILKKELNKLKGLSIV